jgi:hypothetical protein
MHPLCATNHSQLAMDYNRVQCPAYLSAGNNSSLLESPLMLGDGNFPGADWAIRQHPIDDAG